MIRFLSPLVLLGALIASPIALAQEPAKEEARPKVKEEVITEDFIGIEASPDEHGVIADGPKGASTPGQKPYVLRQRVTVQTPAGSRNQTRYVQLDPLLHDFGMSLVEADDALRSQLEIPAGEGVVVMTIKPDSLADHAGLKPKDILLSLGETPAKNVPGVKKVLLGLTKQAIQVKLVREGKRLQLSVVGPEHGLPAEATEYWIGVPVSPVDATLRSHLSSMLPPETGLVANDVVKDSAADKAGVKKNDILILLNNQLLKDTEAMIAAVQASGGNPTELILIRAGKKVVLTVTPAKRTATPMLALENFKLFYQDTPIQRIITPGYAVTFSKPLSEAEAERGTKELNQQPGSDGKIEVTHLLSGQKVRVDPKSILDPKDAPAASPVPIPHDAEKMKEKIYLQLHTKNAADPTTARTDRLEAQMKELSTKLDEIRTLLEGLKKSESK